MRLFNSNAASTLMNRPGVPDETAIESKIVSRAIQSAQSQVEGRNAEIRKNVLKYDDVLNRQREAIYADRKHILAGDEIADRVAAFLDQVISDVVDVHIVEQSGNWNLEALWVDLANIYPISLSIEEVLEEAGSRAKLTKRWLIEEILSDATLAYRKREEQIGEVALAQQLAGDMRLDEVMLRQAPRKALAIGGIGELADLLMGAAGGEGRSQPAGQGLPAGLGNVQIKHRLSQQVRKCEARDCPAPWTSASRDASYPEQS